MFRGVQPTCSLGISAWAAAVVAGAPCPVPGCSLLPVLQLCLSMHVLPSAADAADPATFGL